jgi:MFS family permease
MTHDDYPYATRADAKLWQAAGEGAALAVSRPLREQLQQEETDPGLWKLTFTIAIALLVAAVGNGLLAPVAELIEPGPGFAVGISFLLASVGSIGAQAALLAILAVWGAGPLWVRQIWHWGLAFTAYSAWLLGLLITFADQFGNPYSDLEEVTRVILLGLPAMALAVQLAVWPAKIYLYWRIVPTTRGDAPDEPGPPPADQFSIRDMIVATLVVAASLGALRFGKPENTSEADYWLAWGIACGSAACGSVLVVLLVYLTLGVRRVWLGALGVTATLGSLAGIASAVLIWIAIPGPTSNEIILMMTSVVCGFAFVAAGTLWVARSLGYRLSMTRPLGESPFQAAAAAK